ncbi:MAG: TIGR02147 family protein [Bdellovibrionota bacterium]
MSTTGLHYQSFLTSEFARRKRRNSGYSLRAFARDLEIPAPKLSQILSGRCGLSGNRATTLALRLGLSEKDAELFVLCVETQHSRSAVAKARAKQALAQLTVNDEFENLDLDRFSIIRDWFHFAILELTEVKDFSPEIEWISKRLGIGIAECSAAVQRLMDFGLLQEDAVKGLKQSHADLATPSGIPSRELRDHHSQVLRKAEAALEEVPVAERDISEITMAIDSRKLKEASAWIKDFRRKFCRDLQESAEKDRVYCLAIQFFPFDQKKESS